MNTGRRQQNETKAMKRKFNSLYLAVLALAGLVDQLNAQSTAFTYQGRLEQNGQPATGLYKMVFRLYDRELEGTPLTAFPASSVPVTNGLFTVKIDLDRFNLLPSEAWLEIFVATNGPSEFTLLEPRTHITPTPKANYARLAGSVTNHSIGAEQIASSNKPDPGYMLTFDGDSLVWKDPVQTRNIWSLNSTNAFYNGGRVGIGTQTPAARLHVSQGGLAVTGAGSPYTGAGRGVFMESYPSFGVLFAYDYLNTRPLPLALNSPGGNVGIGTSNPRSPLDVVGNWDGEFGTMNLSGRYPTIRLTGDSQTANQSWIMHMGSLRPGNLEFYRRSSRKVLSIRAGTWRSRAAFT